MVDPYKLSKLLKPTFGKMEHKALSDQALKLTNGAKSVEISKYLFEQNKDLCLDLIRYVSDDNEENSDILKMIDSLNDAVSSLARTVSRIPQKGDL